MTASIAVCSCAQRLRVNASDRVLGEERSTPNGVLMMGEKLASEEVKYDPICPHCEKKIAEVHWRTIQAFHAEYVFMCPHCKKVLGIGVRKTALIN